MTVHQQSFLTAQYGIPQSTVAKLTATGLSFQQILSLIESMMASTGGLAGWLALIPELLAILVPQPAPAS